MWRFRVQCHLVATGASPVVCCAFVGQTPQLAYRPGAVLSRKAAPIPLSRVVAPMPPWPWSPIRLLPRPRCFRGRVAPMPPRPVGPTRSGTLGHGFFPGAALGFAWAAKAFGISFSLPGPSLTSGAAIAIERMDRLRREIMARSHEVICQTITQQRRGAHTLEVWQYNCTMFTEERSCL